ncbi:MAG: type II secretion system protein [Patescibacteria group bacterium]|nr:type II secretion system protein [Patescibacteria group bacterium]
MTRFTSRRARESFEKGFTLIELIVAVALFTVVMLIAMTALLAIANADRKAQSIQSVVDNLDFALDDMSRIVRTGTVYHCTDMSGDTLGAMGNPTVQQGCPEYGSSYIALLPSGADPSSQTDRIVYWYSSSCEGFSGGCIEKSTDSGQTFLPLTSPDVSVDSMRFYVPTIGTWPQYTTQPKVLIELTAHINVAGGSPTTLRLETTLTQRVYNE